MRRLLIPILQGALLLCSAQSAGAEIRHNRFESGRISIDTATGARCSSTGADRASFTVAGTHHDDTSFNAGREARVVAGISIPFGGPSLGNCNTLLEHEEARSRLELAAQLFEAGAIDAEEFKEIAEEVADLVR
jgi:hypothetical protein